MAAFSNHAKFKLGKLAATPGAIELMAKAGKGPEYFLGRHQSGDWGDICDEDKQLNDEAVANEGKKDKQSRVLSAYKTKSGQKLWVITEWNRSVTTILLPEEY